VRQSSVRNNSVNFLLAGSMLLCATFVSAQSADKQDAETGSVSPQAAVNADKSAGAASTAAEKSIKQPRVKSRVPAGYKLVWSDEFDADGLPDPKKWKYDIYRNAQGWYNVEKQYYSNARLKNSRIENGNLIIEAHKEDLSGEGFSDWGGQKYSSARLMTKGLGDWTKGFFEIRAKIPCGLGTWPAIWTLPSDPGVKWPSGGEIDIMEHF